MVAVALAQEREAGRAQQVDQVAVATSHECRRSGEGKPGSLRGDDVQRHARERGYLAAELGKVADGRDGLT